MAVGLAWLGAGVLCAQGGLNFDAPIPFHTAPRQTQRIGATASPVHSFSSDQFGLTGGYQTTSPLQNDEAEGRSGNTGGSSPPGDNSGDPSATVNSLGILAGLANAQARACGNIGVSMAQGLVDKSKDMTAAMIYDTIDNLFLQRYAISGGLKKVRIQVMTLKGSR